MRSPRHRRGTGLVGRVHIDTFGDIDLSNGRPVAWKRILLHLQASSGRLRALARQRWLLAHTAVPPQPQIPDLPLGAVPHRAIPIPPPSLPIPTGLSMPPSLTIPPPPMPTPIIDPDETPPIAPFSIAEPEFPQLLDMMINEGHISDRHISLSESLTPRGDTFFPETAWL
jgi:hypothetical protein